MPATLTTIGFDADDTLWQNEHFYKLTEARFATLLTGLVEPGELSAHLLEVERKNLGHYGFGIKGFTLSMVETAIEVTQGAVPASVIAEILEAGRDMLRHPVETLPHVRETLAALAGKYRMVMITKGDLFDQERKLAESGPRRTVRRRRDRQRQGRRHLPARLHAAWRRARARHDGRQLAEIRRAAGDRRGKLGRLHPARPQLGHWSRPRRRCDRRATASLPTSANWPG